MQQETIILVVYHMHPFLFLILIVFVFQKLERCIRANSDLSLF